MTCGGSESNVVASEGVIARRSAIARPIAKAAVRIARVIEDFAIRNRWLSRNTLWISRFRRNSPTIDAVRPYQRDLDDPIDREEERLQARALSLQAREDQDDREREEAREDGLSNAANAEETVRSLESIVVPRHG